MENTKQRPSKGAEAQKRRSSELDKPVSASVLHLDLPPFSRQDFGRINRKFDLLKDPFCKGRWLVGKQRFTAAHPFNVAAHLFCSSLLALDPM